MARAIRNAIRANRFAIEIQTPIFIVRQAGSPESLEFPIRANDATKFSTIFAVFRSFSHFFFWPSVSDLFFDRKRGAELRVEEKNVNRDPYRCSHRPLVGEDS